MISQLVKVTIRVLLDFIPSIRIYDLIELDNIILENSNSGTQIGLQTEED